MTEVRKKEPNIIIKIGGQGTLEKLEVFRFK
jgi:hypothetical protein